MLCNVEFAKRKRKSWLTSRCGEVIVRSCAWSVCLSRPLNEAVHIRIVYMSLPSTQVTTFVEITAGETSCGPNIWTSAPWESTGAFVEGLWELTETCSFCDDNVVQSWITWWRKASLSLKHNLQTHRWPFFQTYLYLQSKPFMGCCTLAALQPSKDVVECRTHSDALTAGFGHGNSTIQPRRANWTGPFPDLLLSTVCFF